MCRLGILAAVSVVLSVAICESLRSVTTGVPVAERLIGVDMGVRNGSSGRSSMTAYVSLRAALDGCEGARVPADGREDDCSELVKDVFNSCERSSCGGGLCGMPSLGGSGVDVIGPRRAVGAHFT